MGKRQPMRWSAEGAHLLLQVRCALLDDRSTNSFGNGTGLGHIPAKPLPSGPSLHPRFVTRPTPRVRALLRRHGRGPETALTVLSDGEGGHVHDRRHLVRTRSTHVLDWFHIARRLGRISRAFLHFALAKERSCHRRPSPPVDGLGSTRHDRRTPAIDTFLS